MKIVLNVGHGGEGKDYDSGAVAEDGTHEHIFNRDKLVPIVKRELEKMGYDAIIIIQRNSFGELSKRINDVNPDLILSFHLNAFNKASTGTEVLYWHTSKKSQRLATLIQNALVKVLGLKDRGIKPKTDGDRGAALLKKTNAPCALIETAFIDNKHDMEVLDQKLDEVVKAIGSAVDSFLKPSS